MTGRTTPPITASFFTLAGNLHPLSPPLISPVPFEERAAAAAAAGFHGIGLGIDDLEHLVRTMGTRGILSICQAASLALVEVEALTDWFATGERRERSDRVRASLLRSASELGIGHIKVLGDLGGTVWPHARLVDEFGLLCEQAAAAGTRICIEVFPTSGIPNVTSGRQILEGVAHAHGGLLLDIWHMIRGGERFETIAELRPGHILHVELDDGTLEPRGPFLEETVDRRLLCGDGEFPIGEFVSAVQRAGYSGPYGLEILSERHRQRAISEAASVAFATTKQVLDRLPSTPLEQRS